MTGMKNYDTGMLDDSTGMLDDNTGMLEEDAGLIDEGSGLIMENDSEDTLSGRRKRSRERGKDLKSRNFPLHTLKNLPQFRNKPHEEVRHYILEKKELTLEATLTLEV